MQSPHQQIFLAVGGIGGLQLPELPLLPPPGSLGGGGVGQVQFVLPDFSPCPQVTTEVIRKWLSYTVNPRWMGPTGSGWQSSFQVRMETIPQCVCLKTAPRPPPQQPPRSHSMTTFMMSTGPCLDYFLMLIPSFKASTRLSCMSHYWGGSDQTAGVM